MNREIAQKVLEVVDQGLVMGDGIPIPGHMCVEAAVCYALGMEHGDDPKCVSRTLRELKIALNDSIWPSREARAAGLRKLAILQLGTNVDFNEYMFVERVALFTINTILPITLRADGFEEYANACAAAKTLEKAVSAAYATHVTYAVDAAYAAYDACAAPRAARKAAHASDNPQVLNIFADGVADILIEMKVPGVAWLDLLDEEKDI